MSKLAGIGTGPALGFAGAATVVLGVGLYAAGVFDAPEPVDEVEPVALLQPEPEAQPVENEVETVEEAQAETAPDTASEPVETAAAETPDPPSIDTFRLEPDGTMLVAGQAHPGWATAVTLDGAELDSVELDNKGKFVTFLTVEQSDEPRVLSLIMRDPESEVELASLDEIIIAPTPRIAEAEAEPDTADATPDTTQDTSDATQSDTASTETAAVEPAEEPAPTATTEPEPATTTVVAEDTAPEPEPEQTAWADSENTETSQTVLLSNESGVQVLQPATPSDNSPDVMSSVALDAITYSEEGDVQLSGRAQGDGFVQVYIDNAPVITSPITEDGNWSTDLPEVDTGVYTLRIDETDAEGNVVSRVETPFKREDEEVLTAASQAIAQQTIKAITVQPGSTLWAISRERYGEGLLYVRVFEANRDRIRDPDLIYPGQVFTLPE